MDLSFNKLMEQSLANHQLVGRLAGCLALFLHKHSMPFYVLHFSVIL